MIRIWVEEWFDTLLMLFLIVGSLIFSFYYWKGQYQVRYTKIVVEEFLENSSTEGEVSVEEIEVLLQQIHKIDSEYSLELIYNGIKLEPCYAILFKERLDDYYLKRNVRREIVLEEQTISIPEEVNFFHLQEETNASILAAGKEQYLPLPEDEAIFSVVPVRPEQRVYEGEALITLCLVTSADGNYYVEAEPVIATSSGIVSMKLQINGQQKYVEVNVICYPRELSCVEGHKFSNTKERIEEFEMTGMQSVCPICQELPKEIECSQDTMLLKTGEHLESTSIFLEVTYLDGHIEKILPSMKEWKDNYDENFCGVQTVTVQYGNLQDTVVVVSEGKDCSQCGNVCTGKTYQDYIEFPYCTECMSKSILFTGEVYEEELRMNLKELIAFLEEERILFMEAGDRLTISVKKGNNYISIMEKIVVKNRKVSELE